MVRKTAIEQKIDDLKEVVVDGFNKNSDQHLKLFDEQKKTNGNIINHEARIGVLEESKRTEEKNSKIKQGFVVSASCAGATILTTIILKVLWR